MRAAIAFTMLATACVTPVAPPGEVTYPARLEGEVSAAVLRWFGATGLEARGVDVIEEPPGGDSRCENRYGWHFDGTIMLCASTPRDAIEVTLVHEFGHALGAHGHMVAGQVGIMRENISGTRCLTQYDVDFMCGMTWRECHWRKPECRVTVLQ